ncbi:hypothetical protein M0R45_025907 [Rubus argutus]|uniref:Uncharacterized protein n=1 Tax=Rubus argutus TaxID=59490 RepID=A0AAW1WZC3_RUBAR
MAVWASCSSLISSSNTTTGTDDSQINMEKAADTCSNPVNDPDVDNPMESSIPSHIATAINDADSAPGISKLVPESNSSGNGGGHGPWMLMSYKNKKAYASSTPSNKAHSHSGSRFALLQTFTEETDGALRELEPTAVEDLSKNDTPAKDQIVKIWKKVQSKSKKTMSSTHLKPNDPKPAKAMKKPLNDITNGKSYPKPDSAGTSMSGTATHSRNPQTSRMISFCPENTFMPNFSTSSPPVNNGTNSFPIINSSAIFGHCPPENAIVEHSTENEMERRRRFRNPAGYGFVGGDIDDVCLRNDRGGWSGNFMVQLWCDDDEARF